MFTLANGFVALTALAQFSFMVLEMLFWPTIAQHVAGMNLQQAQDTMALGANQGLYNGFLGAGLFWSLLAPAAFSKQLALFFVVCVLVAALYGGYSVSRRILVLQGSPALLALIFLLTT